MRARIDTVTDNLRRGTVHTLYTPTEEAEICLNCPLRESVISASARDLRKRKES